jgi:glutathione S-transferase
MKARKQYSVDYPNLYATPGYHKEADAFNRVQRGHQAVLVESLPSFTVSALVAGVYYPITMSITGIAWSVGAYLFLLGYSDTGLDVKMARYKKGGMVFRLANAVAFGACVRMSGKLLGWWSS